MNVSGSSQLTSSHTLDCKDASCIVEDGGDFVGPCVAMFVASRALLGTIYMRWAKL
jgi:hypothetical protein